MRCEEFEILASTTSGFKGSLLYSHECIIKFQDCPFFYTVAVSERIVSNIT